MGSSEASSGSSGWGAPMPSLMGGFAWPSMVSNMLPGPGPGPMPFMGAWHGYESAGANPAFMELQESREEKRYDGTVKCFYGEKHTGHGFIYCPEIYNRTGQDVYLHARQAHRCEVGDEVSFTVVFNSRREPQARSVVKKTEEGKFLSKKREEAEKQATALQQKRAHHSSSSAAPSPSSVMTEEQAKKFQKSLKR